MQVFSMFLICWDHEKHRAKIIHIKENGVCYVSKLLILHKAHDKKHIEIEKGVKHTYKQKKMKY
jgi:hypothetical protein